MYDTLHFWIDRALLNNNPFQIVQYLTNTVESRSEKGCFVKAGVDNFRVSVSESGISIKGSLSKFYFGNNIQTLTLEQTFEAIQMLSDRLQVNLFEVKVTRIDIGAVFIMDNPPEIYFSYLGNKSRSKRLLATEHSLYYKIDKKWLAFYDKSKEAKVSKMNIPKEFKNKNLLRYELRFLSKLPKQLNETEIFGATLCQEAFYKKLVQYWKDEYVNIEKLNLNSDVNLANVATPKDVENEVFNCLLQEKGIDFVNNIIRKIKAQQAFSDSKYYTRTSKNLRERLMSKTSTPANTISELDSYILASC